MIVLLLAVSCQEKPVIDENGISLKTEEAEYENSSQWLKVKAEGDWTLSVTSEDGEEIDWAWVKQASGTGSISVLFSWSKNTGDIPRTCRIEMLLGGKAYDCYFTQKAQTSNKTVSKENFKSEPVPTWLELPTVNTTEKLYYVTHEMTLQSGKKCRNYSFLFDIDNHIARWVAYPLNKTLIGSGSRHFSGTSYWAGTVDPKVPREYQAVLERAYSGMWGINRGHQIPSADRLTSDANFQTFYGTNMTPQSGALNSNAWATLEGMVRSWANSFDTLYVVTGADIAGAKDYARDNDGKSVLCPSGYFKALLGYRKGGTFGITGKTGGYTGIGLYFKGDEDDEMGTTEIMTHSMTIDELEKKLGYDFFPGLGAKTTFADYVESTKDSWWK